MGGDQRQRGLQEGKAPARFALLILVVLVVAGAVIIGTAGCDVSRPVDPCVVNPTRLAADGTWLEHDGEPLDGDPCDSDDLLPKARVSTVKVPQPPKPLKTYGPVTRPKGKF